MLVQQVQTCQVSRILEENVVSLPHANILRNLPHFSFCDYFSSILSKNWKFSLITFTSACYSSICNSFLLRFFHIFLASMKLPELREPIRHRFGSHLCFLLCDGESPETK